ncbi:uncharacterized protein IL334_005561 [Kwoniella shivajii]|uniref:Developmental regulatory protein wetA n=1 Tax=Kwoniella shivajii TaxID=564305 RepID=A0ABZ1D3T3_9TREE|nr:hypothetical protein IL334_005561 [Kwoniella shivajii]
MESIFESDSYLLDPSSSQYDSESFLSFSSFSDLTWNDFSVDIKRPPARSVSDTPSPTISEPFEIISAVFPPTPAETSDYGIFHTPTKYSNVGEEQPGFFSHQSSGSTDSWGEPITPSLSGKSFAALSSNNTFTPSQSTTGFAWDEATPSFSGSSFTPPTPSYQAHPHRVTSNPVIGSSSRKPRALNKPTSMPVLKEEETTTQWVDGINILDAPLQLPDVPLEASLDDDNLLEGFDWSFNPQDLSSFSTDGTIFAAFNEPTDPIPMMHSHSHTGVFPTQTFDQTHFPSASTDYPSWMPEYPTSQDVAGLGDFNIQSQPFGLLPAFTIDPMAIMSTNGVDEDSSRPSSAPGLNGGEGSKEMLSVPTADVMMRSLSSEGFVPSRYAPPRDLFSYAPQQIPTGPPGPQPLYTSDPSPSYHTSSSFQRVMPPTPSHAPIQSKRAANNLSIKIHPPAQSTFIPSPFPPTPQSATFPISLSAAQAQQPIAMQRAGTQPLPQTRKLSGSSQAGSIPAHLARAQAIVQQQQARDQAERDSIRREAASRRVGMANASVMQPTANIPRRNQPTIMGWEGPSAPAASFPVLTHAPLVTVHPPAQYMVTGVPIPVHRVHPPPHPGNAAPAMQARPIARLPSSPVRARKASNNQLTPTRTTPKARSPSSKRKPSSSGFNDPFINFTADDAEKLLTGVAPSGSQSKRKREEEAAAAKAITVSDDDARSKRSRSDE